MRWKGLVVTIEAYEQAKKEIALCARRCDMGALHPGDLFERVAREIRSAVLSALDPLDDIQGLREAAEAALSGRAESGWEYGADWAAGMTVAEQVDVLVRSAVRERERREDVIAEVLCWEGAGRRDEDAPSCGDAATTAAGFLQFDRGTDFGVRVVRSGSAAYGALFLRDIAVRLVGPHAGGPGSATWLRLVLDELADWAASTDPLLRARGKGAESWSDTARRVLVELAGVPDITPAALARLPFHRLDAIDRATLADTMRFRAEFFPEGWVDEEDVWASRAVEFALLKALDAATG